MESMRQWWASRRHGRLIAAGGLIVGVAFLVGQLLASDSAFTALSKGALAAIAFMAVAGVFQSFWAGDRVEEAEAGGVRVKFGAARRAIGELNRRVTHQMADVNRRLYDLEKAVFKGDGTESDQEE